MRKVGSALLLGLFDGAFFFCGLCCDLLDGLLGLFLPYLFHVLLALYFLLLLLN